MSDNEPLRLMGPAQLYGWSGLVWCFTRGGEKKATNQLVFWCETRTWKADVNVRHGALVDRYIYWPHASEDELIALLPEEERAKAVAASLGIFTIKSEAG